jgi:hypothetical protein
MTSCLLQWLRSSSKPSRNVAAADRLLKQSLDVRPEVSDQSRNLWLEALLRAFAGLWPC